MASDPDIVRRVTRLENETESIYELIGDFRSETRARFDRIEGQTRSRFDRIESQTQARFDRIESTLDEIVRRLPGSG
jgi:hypothetical protein